MENPAGCGVLGDRPGKFDSAEFTSPAPNTQAATRAIGAALATIADSDVLDAEQLAEIDALSLATILRRRLTERQRIYLGAACLWSLPPDAAEELAEAALCDLRAGEPTLPFINLRDEAKSWAMFASRAERCNYLAAAWGELAVDDRSRFMRRAL